MGQTYKSQLNEEKKARDCIQFITPVTDLSVGRSNTKYTNTSDPALRGMYYVCFSEYLRILSPAEVGFRKIWLDAEITFGQKVQCRICCYKKHMQGSIDDS